MRKYNLDMFPEPDVQKLYAPVGVLVINPLVNEPFGVFEAKAVRAKGLYHRWGRIGIVLVVLSTLYTVAEALVMPRIDGLRLMSAGMILLGVFGIAIQLYLLSARVKQTWLLNRFGAERVRSIKFQAFPLAATAASADDLTARVNAFYTAEITRLNMELNGGEAALSTFSSISAVKHLAASPAAANAAIFGAAEEAYRDLRFKYQISFAQGEIQALKDAARIVYTSSDPLYLLGAVLTVAALASKVAFGHDAEHLSHWIDFLAVASFIGGLSKTILDNASLSDTS